MLDVNNLLGSQSKTPQRSIFRSKGFTVSSVASNSYYINSVLENIGNDFTYQSDTAQGDRWVINVDGFYFCSLYMLKTAGIVSLVNNGDPTIAADGGINVDRVLASGITVGAGYPVAFSCPLFLEKGDVLRLQTAGNGIGTNVETHRFYLVRLRDV